MMIDFDAAIMTDFDAVILANGEFPTHAIPLTILQRASHVVACDGAIRHYPQADVVVGDGDSIPAAYREKLYQVDEQDDNDLTKATRYCLKHLSPLSSPSTLLASPKLRIAFLGCTGRREDHTLGNIALLMRYYREMGIEGRMFTDYGVFTPVRGERVFPSAPGQQVSIFNFGCSRLESQNLKWNAYAYEQWWQGTLNESLADHFSLKGDDYFLVFQTYV